MVDQMNRDKDLEQMKDEYINVQIPEKGLAGLQETIERAKKDRVRKGRILVYKKIGGCVAAALMIAVLIPNVSINAAMAMEKIPVIGSIVRVITFGRYDFEDDMHEANVEIPKIEIDSTADGQQNTDTDGMKKSVESVNKDMEDYINPIVEEFKKSIEEEYNKSLTISYDVVTDTGKWFTLKIDVLEIEASSYMYSKYYHVNKVTGKQAVLKDIFTENADYITIISENIREQMRQQMKADEGKMYFIDSEDMPETDFEQIKEDQNFYFNSRGEIVIVFDEYEAAPGYMGVVEFTIPKEVTQGIIIEN